MSRPRVVVDAAPGGGLFHPPHKCRSPGICVRSSKSNKMWCSMSLVGDVDDRPPGQHRRHRLANLVPLVLAVEVIEHEEAAAREVLAQTLEPLALRQPVAAARLLQEQPRVIEQVWVVEREVAAVRRHFDARHALDGGQEMRFGVRVVDGPPRVAVTARARAAARVVREPRHVELGLRRAPAWLRRRPGTARSQGRLAGKPQPRVSSVFVRIRPVLCHCRPGTSKRRALQQQRELFGAPARCS